MRDKYSHANRLKVFHQIKTKWQQRLSTSKVYIPYPSHLISVNPQIWHQRMFGSTSEIYIMAHFSWVHLEIKQSLCIALPIICHVTCTDFVKFCPMWAKMDEIFEMNKHDTYLRKHHDKKSYSCKICSLAKILYLYSYSYLKSALLKLCSIWSHFLRSTALL